MAVDMFLKLSNNIKGESKDHKHKDEIDVLAWSWGVSNSGTFHMGGGGGSGKASFQDISVTKYVDNASNGLLRACSTGEKLDTADLFVRKSGKKPLEYIVIKMKDVLVTSISTGGSGGEDRLTENVSLNFREVEYTYLEQKPDGTGGSPMPFKYDIGANEFKG
jgi:type VI secretion system secreted protein Hcp